MSEDPIDAPSEQRGQTVEFRDTATYREATVTSTVPTKAFDTADVGRPFRNLQGHSDDLRPSTSGTTEVSEVDWDERESLAMQANHEQAQEPVNIEPRFVRNDEVTPDVGFIYGKHVNAPVDLIGNWKQLSAKTPNQQLEASKRSLNTQDDGVRHRREFQVASGLEEDSTAADGTAETSNELSHAPEQRSSSPAMQPPGALHSLPEVLFPRQDCSPDRQPQDKMEFEGAPASSGNERHAPEPQDVNDVEMTDATSEDGDNVGHDSQQETSRDKHGAEQARSEGTVASGLSPDFLHPASGNVVASLNNAPKQPLAEPTLPFCETFEEHSAMQALYKDFGSRMRQYEQQLMVKHSDEQHALQSRLDQAVLEKATVNQTLAEVRRQSNSRVEELKAGFERTAVGLSRSLDRLGLHFLGVKDTAGKNSDKIRSLVASSKKMKSEVHDACGVNSHFLEWFESFRKKLTPARQEVEIDLMRLEERNKALATQLRERIAQGEEQDDRLAKLEKHLEEQSQLPTTLANELRTLLEASEQAVTKQFNSLGANVSKQHSTDESTFAATLQGLRDDIRILDNGDNGTTQTLLVIKDTVQKLAESAPNQSERGKLGHDTSDAVNDLKSRLEIILEPIADEVKALTTQMEGAEARRLESTGLQQQIQDRDARLLVEHANSTRLQTEVDQLKETLDSRPMQVEDDSRQQLTRAREEQQRLLDADRAELSLKMNELSVANAGLRDLETEKAALQQQLKALEGAAADFGAEKFELQRRANEALTTKEREMSAVSLRAQAAERAKSDNTIKRLTKELEISTNALEAGRRTSTSEQSLRDRILTQGQRIEELEMLQADEASLKAAHDTLSAEVSTLKSKLSESDTQKVSALQKQAEAQCLLSEAQMTEKQCRSDLQQSRTREANAAGEVDRLATRQKANLEQIKQSYASRTEAQSSKQEELVGQHAAEVDKIRAENDDALKQAENRVKQAESALKILESRFESENSKTRERLSRMTAERDLAVANMQRMREKAEAIEEAEAIEAPAELSSNLQPSVSLIAGSQQEGALTTEPEISRPRKQRKKVVRTAEPTYRGPSVEETQSTDSTAGVFSQIARPGPQAQQREDISEVDDMLDNAMLSSQQASLEASQFRTTENPVSQQAEPIGEETQKGLGGGSLDQSPPAQKTAARVKLPSLRGKLVEQPFVHSQAISGWSPGPENYFGTHADSPDRHSSHEDESTLDVDPEHAHRKAFAKPNSASKLAPRRLLDHREGSTMSGAMEDRRPHNHEATSSSPAFVASQTNPMSRTNTYQASGSAGRLARPSRTPSAPSTVDPRLLQKSSQHLGTTAPKRRASTTLGANADSLEDARKKFRRTNMKAPAIPTSPPSQHTRLRQSANDLPAVPQAAPRSRGVRQVSGNTSSQSRVRSLAGNAGTPRGNKRGKKSSKNDEMNARFDQELSSRR